MSKPKTPARVRSSELVSWRCPTCGSTAEKNQRKEAAENRHIIYVAFCGLCNGYGVKPANAELCDGATKTKDHENT